MLIKNLCVILFYAIVKNFGDVLGVLGEQWLKCEMSLCPTEYKGYGWVIDNKMMWGDEGSH